MMMFLTQARHAMKPLPILAFVLLSGIAAAPFARAQSESAAYEEQVALEEGEYKRSEKNRDKKMETQPLILKTSCLPSSMPCLAMSRCLSQLSQRTLTSFL